MSRPPTFDSGFSTEELTEIFSPDSTVGSILEFEAALALSLGEVGIAPPTLAREVAEACDSLVVDPGSVVCATWDSGSPIIALREAVETSVSPEAGHWFHFGATTQDAIDTGLMLQSRRALAAIDTSLVSLARSLRDLTEAHRAQPQMGRTFLQDATPITFGLTSARWLDAALTHREQLVAESTALPLQLGGPAGAIEAYGEEAANVVARVSETLGLRSPAINWHSDRTTVLSLAHALERTARTMAKLGRDLSILASTAVAEISVRAGGSSSMPSKHNPIDSIRAIAAAAACSGAVAMLMSAPPPDLERGGGWHTEWLAVPLAFHTAGAAVEATARGVASIRVDAGRMTAAAGGEGAGPGLEAQIDAVLVRAAAILD